jgi:hypothetical protein
MFHKTVDNNIKFHKIVYNNCKDNEQMHIILMFIRTYNVPYIQDIITIYHGMNLY